MNITFANSVRMAAFSLAALCLPATASERPELGRLPDGALSVFEVSDVGVEVCQRHVFSPESAPDLPDGYRLSRLSDRATVPWIAELLHQRPDLAGHAHGSFCFIEAGSHTVDDVPIYPGRRSKTAFLWADVVPIAAPPSDPRFHGPIRRVQLFWMYDAEGVDRDLATRAIPNAVFGRITIEKSGETWRVGIESDGSALTAEVTATSARRQLTTGVGFETLALAGEARRHFNIVTYAGHHEQLASGAWRVSGDAQWARAFAEATDAGSFIQDGFAARLGLYPYDRQ